MEVVDLDGDGLPDLLQGDTGSDGQKPEPAWYMWANLGGNLNFDDKQFLRVAPIDHLTASLDGGSATGLLIDDSGTTNSDPRYSVLRVTRKGKKGTKVKTTVTLGTLLRNQQYVFGDFTRSGLPSAFSLGNATRSDPTLAENLGGSFGPPMPVDIYSLRQPPSQFTPALRVFDWNQDGHATLLARTRTATQLNDPMLVYRWNGTGFSETPLPFTSTWDLKFPDPEKFQEQFDIFEVMDYNGDGLDDLVMFSNGQLRVFVRQGNKADLLTGIVDGLGARTSITYKPISDPTVHTPTYGYVYPQRALAGKVWVVAEYRADDGIGGVNTYRFTYKGGVQDVTGLGFLGFHERTTVHVELNVTTTSTYLPEFVGQQGIYPLLGLPTKEVTTTPLGNGQEHVATTTTSYAVRPQPLGTVPFFVIPKGIVEEQVINANGVPTMPVRRRTTTQDMDAFGNVTTRAEVWSDGNTQTTTCTYLNDPSRWLIGLLIDSTEQSTSPNGLTQTRRRAYQYDEQGLLSREIIEPGAKGYLPLGPQPDGVKTLYRTFERYPNGNLSRTSLEETTQTAGAKRSTSIASDDVEHIFPVEISDDLGHRVRATYHPGLGVQTSYTEQDGAQTIRHYDGFGRLRDQLAADGSHLSAHYLDAGGKLRITLAHGSGEVVHYDHDVLGRVVRETRFARDDGAGVIRDIRYNEFGRIRWLARPRFAADPPASPAYKVYSYDALGRISAEAGADGTSTAYEYRGEWVITIDGETGENLGAVKLDNLERPVFVTDRDAALVGSGTAPAGMTIAYGPFNVVATVTDIAGNVTTRTSDRLGRPIDIVDPDHGHIRYAYNAFGDLVQATKGNGQLVAYEYDQVGRPTAIRDAVDGDVTLVWDTGAVGKVAQIAAPASGVTTAFTYDAAGRPIAKTCTIGSDAYTITHTFDSSGRLAGITYPKVGALGRFRLRYEYGNYGQLLRATDASTGQVYWRWMASDASAAFGEDRLGNGLVDRWIEHATRPGVLAGIQTVDASQNLVRDTSYGFDGHLNLTERDDKVLGTTERFTYDSFKRLQRWSWKGAAGTRGVRWDYDDIGNLQLRAIEVGPGADLAYTYDPSVAGPHAVVATTLGAYTYDARGNQTSAPGRVVMFGRGDLPTRILQTGTAHPKAIDLVYDGQGARVRTIDQLSGLTTDTLDGLYELRRPNGAAGPNGHHVFVIAVRGRLVARRTWTVAKQVRTADRLAYLHADHQGSIELVTGSQGKVLERLKYDPFGRRVDIDDPAKPRAVNITLHTGYTGHEHLDGWHLIDMRGRVNDPTIGKFLSADPMVSNPLNPQAWNRYAYVLNNPLSLRDPTGFQDDEEDKDKNKGPGRGTKYESTVRGQWRGPTSKAAAQPSPPPQPRNDDGYGGAAQTGLPPNAGVPPNVRVNTARDPAEALLRFNREISNKVERSMPFSNRERNASYERVVVTTAAVGSLLLLPLLAAEALPAGALGVGWRSGLQFAAKLFRPTNSLRLTIGEVYEMTYTAARNGIPFLLGRFPDLPTVEEALERGQFILRLPDWSRMINAAAIRGYIDGGGRFILTSNLADVVNNAWVANENRWLVTFLELMQIVSSGHQYFK